MNVRVRLPRILADTAGGARELTVDVAGGTVGDVLSAVSMLHPVLARRLRDETGALRRYVNVYVDGADIRREQGLDTPVTADAVVQVLPSVAGG